MKTSIHISVGQTQDRAVRFLTRSLTVGARFGQGRADGGAGPTYQVWAALLFAFAVSCGAQTNTVSAPTQWLVVSSAANSEILSQTTSHLSPTGQAVQQVHHVTRIASGLNYWDGTAWQRSDPNFEMSQDGQHVFANQVQTKIQLAANLAQSNSVIITSPDGIVLNTTPVAIGLYDEVSGNSTIIASITNCSGTLISSNQVIYENCFNGISGSIIYTLQQGSFSQDVVWNQDIEPGDYGFSTNSTRIQIFSAFNSPAPQEIARPLYVETNQAIRAQMASPDFIDHTLKFGQLKFGPGHVFSTTATNRFEGAPIAKDFETINGQGYVVESIEIKDIRKDLQALPRGTASRTLRTKMARKASNDLLEIPTVHPTTKAKFAVKIRKSMLAEAFEPRGVIADYANPALQIMGNTTDLNNLRISDAGTGVYSEQGVNVMDMQMINCGTGFYNTSESGYFENVLIVNAGTGFAG
jgi:hypothetical protein